MPFAENLEQFSHMNPKAAITVAEMKKKPLVKEIAMEEWVKSLPIQKVELLYLFGIGLGESYLALESWLQENLAREVVFLEDDYSVIRSFLEEDSADEFFKNPRVHLFAFQEGEEEENLFQKLSWQFMQKQLAVFAIPSYAKTREPAFQRIKERITFESANKNEMIDEYLKFGIVYYRNFYKNLQKLPGCCHGNTLFSKFKNVPAIICGAGPSLQKNLSLLHTLKDKALIFAGGSSLNALCYEKITPHFGAGIDPNPTQYYRLMGHDAKSVPFFFRLRMHHQAFSTLTGERLYINGSGGYTTAEWVEERLDIPGEVLDEGHNVVNFCTEIALAMGCNPIIFVGLDLAFSDLKSYAKGVVEDPAVSKEEITETDSFESAAVVRPDIYGKPVYTLWKWIAESEWLSKLAKEHPETTMINATEGGIGFQDIPNRELRSIEFQQPLPLEERITKAIQEAKMPQVTDEKIHDIFAELETSLIACEEHLKILLEENAKIEERLLQGELVEITHTGRSALAISDLEEEEAYKAILDVFNSIKAFQQQGALQASKKESDAIKRLFINTRLLGDRYEFLLHVVEANLILLREAKK